MNYLKIKDATEYTGLSKSTLKRMLRDLLKEIIVRHVPPESDAEKEELEEFLQFNMIALIEEMMIAFRFSTREQLKKQKELGASILSK